MHTKPSVGIRIASMLLDHFFMCMIMAVICFPFMLSSLTDTIKIDQEQSKSVFSDSTLYVFCFVFALYSCKDCIGGRSLAKRILKLQVINNQRGTIANPLRCMVRNLFDIIWPIEVIASIINPSRRIGDFVAGTAVVIHQPSENRPVTNIVQALMALLLSFGFFTALFMLMYSMLDN